MPENIVKLPRSASPVARSGAGDISERELSRERNNLQTTPPARPRVNPKKQLFSAPLNKFTTKSFTPSPNLARIRSCLHEFTSQTTPTRATKVVPKAASMEDLTPTKRIKLDKKDNEVSSTRLSAVSGAAEQQAAAVIGRFMLVAAWRRRRDEVRCLRRTLETQVSCSERLRVQVYALKSLLDSDNAKVRLAMRELDRLKQLLKEKEMEKAVLEKEKLALEGDVCAAEDKASEMSIGWRNCRNELEGVRAAAAAAAAASEHARAQQQRAAADLRRQRDHAYTRLSELEEELTQHEGLLTAAETTVTELRLEADQREEQLKHTIEQLELEHEARSRCASECSLLWAQAAAASEETSQLRRQVYDLQVQLARLQQELDKTTEQLKWWPEPLTRLLGTARSWLSHRMSLSEALLWTATPARHGCW